MKCYTDDQMVEIVHNLHPADCDMLSRAGVPKEVLWMTAALITTVGRKVEKDIEKELREIQKRDPVTAARIRKDYNQRGRRQPKRIPSFSIDMLLRAIRGRNPAFNKWETLADVLCDMFALRGWSYRHITGGMLRKRWKRENAQT